MMYLNDFLNQKIGYRFETLDDAKFLCYKLHKMGYTWGSGKPLDDFIRLEKLYRYNKVLKFVKRDEPHELMCGVCWDNDTKEVRLFKKGYVVDLL